METPIKKIEITKQRHVNTYAEMWLTSRVLLANGKIVSEGSTHQYRGSLLFTAFSLEAYLNHLGDRLFSCWEELERLSPKSKLKLIGERLNVKINFGEEPWQVMGRLFGFRNDIAHGKSECLKEKHPLPMDEKVDSKCYSFLETDWEQCCNLEFAENARKQVERILRTLHDASGIKDHSLFNFGLQIEAVSIITGNGEST